MTADEEITLSGSAQIQCVATDKDKDTLSYQWSADGGMIEGTGDNVTWIPPDSVGDYTIEVTVTDDQGGEAVDSVTIAVVVKLNQPPTIISLTAEEEQVSKWMWTTIECQLWRGSFTEEFSVSQHFADYSLQNGSLEFHIHEVKFGTI